MAVTGEREPGAQAFSVEDRNKIKHQGTKYLGDIVALCPFTPQDYLLYV